MQKTINYSSLCFYIFLEWITTKADPLDLPSLTLWIWIIMCCYEDSVFLRLQKYKWKQDSSNVYDEITFYLVLKLTCYSYKSFILGSMLGFFSGYTRDHHMHISLDCMLKVDTRVLSKGFSSVGGEGCTSVLGEGHRVLFAPQCGGLMLKPKVLNILIWIVSYFFKWLKYAC